MKYTLSVVLFLLFTLPCFSQSPLVEQAKEYANALVNREFEKVASLTHPEIVELGGGAEYIKGDLEKERQMLVDSGSEFVSAQIGEVGQYFEENGEIQTIFPISFQLMINKEEFTAENHVLAVSKDKGNKWYFVDLAKYDKESLKTFVKNLNDELPFPEK